MSGKYPVTLYLYDINTGNVLYAGYYSDVLHAKEIVKIVKLGEEKND